MSGFVAPILVAAVGVLLLLVVLLVLLGHAKRLNRAMGRLRRSTTTGLAPLASSAAAIRARRNR
ncbi:MAG: hypothetical protein OJJ54_19285 [Pseudonocardia sp.]|nr:hypothetical protein [Pseudonocardia sp.]